MILADTNIVSEFMRATVDPAVLRWASSIAPGDIVLSAITVQEIEYGILRLPEGRRRDDLDTAWSAVLRSFESVLVPYDRAAASAAALILAEAAADGRGMSLADAQIAGTCRAHGLVLATRNVRDFAGVAELSVLDPFATQR